MTGAEGGPDPRRDTPIATRAAPVWHIRDGTEDDLAVVNEVFRRSSLSNEADRALLAAHPEVLVLTAAELRAGRTRVALDGTRVVAFTILIPGDGLLELDALFVHPDRMRRGIGAALVADAVALAAELGLDRIEVSGNDQAMSFYRAAGFQVIGVVDTPLGVPVARLRRMANP